MSKKIHTFHRSENGPPLAFSYVRFSRTHQRKGMSLERQENARNQYLERTGIELDTQLDLRDLGVSGFTGRHRTHGKLRAFLDAIETGYVRKGDVLIVENLDRLTREEISEALELFLGIIRNGIKIVTLSPYDEFDRQSISDTTKIIVAIITLGRAHEESKRKSDLILKKEQQKREQRQQGKVVGGQIPAWIERHGDKFKVIPEAKRAIERIFQLCLDGHGQWTISRTLNDEGIPNISRRCGKHTKDRWTYSYIKRILTTRQVIGEHQQYKGKLPIGEPLIDYFPAVIDEATFEAAQLAMKARATRKGPIGKNCKNLFTGLLRDPRDNTTYTVISKGKRSPGPQYVSCGAKQGFKGSVYLAFPLDAVETAFLHFLRELVPTDLLPPQPQTKDIAKQVREAESKVVNIETKIETIKTRLKGDTEQFSSLVDVLADLDGDLIAARNELDKLRSRMDAAQVVHLTEANNLLDLLDEAEEKNELFEIRTKLKAAISRIVKEIWMVVYRTGDQPKDRSAVMEIRFRGGGVRIIDVDRNGNAVQFTIRCGDLPKWADLREWEKQGLTLQERIVKRLA